MWAAWPFSCTEWMYEYCLGIHPDFNTPAFQKVTFRPYMDTSGIITYAEGHYDSPRGTIKVAWKAEEGAYRYQVTVPEGIDYSFDFGTWKVACHIQTGQDHNFVLRPNK